MTFEIGQQIGDYVVDELLGTGGMGAVYRAHSVGDGSLVAIKEFQLAEANENDDENDGTNPRPDSATETAKITLPAGQSPATLYEKALYQFRREAELLQNLDHANLPKVKEYYDIPSGACYVMTFIPGRNLRSILEERERQGQPPLSVDRVLFWMKQVLEALAYCHEHQFVHCDVKPANIIVDDNDKATLVDFGLSREHMGVKGQTTLVRGQTHHYSPPEHYVKKRRIDQRGDIYSFGATLYVLLTSQLPEDAKKRKRHVALIAPRQHNAAIPAWLESIVLQAMAVKVGERYQSAPALKAALERRGGALGVAAEWWQSVRRWWLPARLIILTLMFSGWTIVFPIHVIRGPGWLYSVAMSPGKYTVAAGNWAGNVSLWNVSDSRLLGTYPGHTDGVHALAFSPDGRLLASGGEDGFVLVWDVVTTREVFSGTRTGSVSSVAFSRDGTWLASGSKDGSARIWQVSDGALVTSLSDHPKRVTSVAFSPDGSRLATAGDDGALVIWSVPRGDLIHTFDNHVSGSANVVYSPDGNKLASGYNAVVKLWDARTGEELRTFDGHTTAAVQSIAISPDGRWLASGSSDATVKLWKTDVALVVDSFNNHTGQINSLSFSPDGLFLASASSDGTVVIWDMRPFQAP